MDVDAPLPGPSTASTSAGPKIVPMAASNKGRSPGKAHKSQKQAKVRSYISPAIKTPFEKRKEAEKKKESVKEVEKDMKEETQAERARKADAIRERRARAAEKKRLEEAKAKMSAKKLQRMRKREGRSKKING